MEAGIGNGAGKGLIRLQLRLLEKEDLPEARFRVERLLSRMTSVSGGLTGMPKAHGIRKSPFEEQMDELDQCRRRVRELEETRLRLKEMLEKTGA